MLGYLSLLATAMSKSLTEIMQRMSIAETQIAALNVNLERMNERFDLYFGNWKYRIPDRIEQP